MTKAVLVLSAGALASAGTAPVDAGAWLGDLTKSGIMGVVICGLAWAYLRLDKLSRQDRADLVQALVDERKSRDLHTDVIASAINNLAAEKSVATEAYRAQAHTLGRLIDAVRGCQGAGRRWGDEDPPRREDVPATIEHKRGSPA